MQIIETILKEELKYPFQHKYALEKLLFLDIETTGLSSNMSYLYLIGCIYYKEDKPVLLQWFSEGIEEEKELLIQFFTFLSKFQVIIHYNGSGFDLPYLIKKCKRYLLPYNFDSMISLDIYREIAPYKRLLNLESLKQRSIEEFLGIQREDSFTGGDLIPVYSQYVGIRRYENLKNVNSDNSYKIMLASGLPSIMNTKSYALLQVLLLHNKEDLTGLLSISSVLAYVDLFTCNINKTLYNFTENELKIHINLFSKIPNKLYFDIPIRNTKYVSGDSIENNNNCEMAPFSDINDNLTLLKEYVISYRFEYDYGDICIPYFKTELKHFFKDYKDYYYLPSEDSAIHKSLAEYVDKNYRKKATKSTAYIKKSGYFLPQVEKLFDPEFQIDCKDKLFWFDSKEAIGKDKSFFSEEGGISYIGQLLSFLL